MREERRQSRMRAIETAAYDLIAESGFERTSMLSVAKRAEASNETLYRWYGDKYGMLESMVRANADQVRGELQQAVEGARAPMETLTCVAEALLTMLLSEHAITLSRAATTDPTGALGQLLAQAGRTEVLPLIQQVLNDAVGANVLGRPTEGDLGVLFVNLLVGDQQIRRVIGSLDVPSNDEVAAQTARALAQLRMLCPVSAVPGP